jgi:hypothetical protein
MACGVEFNSHILSTIHRLQSVLITQPLSLFHYHSSYISHFASSHPAVNIFSGVHVQKVFFLMSCQCGSAVLKGSVLNSTLTWNKVHSTPNTFQRCLQCENLRQTDPMGNMVLETPPIWYQPSPLTIIYFSTCTMTLIFINFCSM